MKERSNTEVNEAIRTLASHGVIAKDEEEAYLLSWYRKLTPEERRIELARARGIAQGKSYSDMKGA
ncbi:MAG: hypothetical protein IJ071_06720 [Ruminococcus sp.]|nr:hypothetical protein [Ruminococcus sp.]